MTGLDWGIVLTVAAIILGGAIASKTLMRSVADFLAAGRTAGRYVLCVSSGIAGLGAITVVGHFEMNYVAGFPMSWWGLSNALFFLVLTAIGWVIYRFRQTRALTLSQFFEMRYSRRFRIFAGILAFVSGIVNFGIFPSVGSRFFIYFCGLPQSFTLFGLEISTFPVTMIVLLTTALYFVFSGGQIAVMITDFLQGIIVNVIFVILIIYFFVKFDWSMIGEALAGAPENASLINPFKTSHVKDFNFWYFLIGLFGGAYSALSWQGAQAYNTSAKSAHEAKMGGMLGSWRGIPQNIALLLIPVVAYMVMHHPAFAAKAGAVNATLATVDTSAIRSQLTVPMVLIQILPKGLVGAFVALMLAAFISTHDTYMHSWGSIFIQDVIMPFRKKTVSSRPAHSGFTLFNRGRRCVYFLFQFAF